MLLFSSPKCIIGMQTASNFRMHSEAESTYIFGYGDYKSYKLFKHIDY